jgi:diguanylate cyclase (GGDEF)-like protein
LPETEAFMSLYLPIAFLLSQVIVLVFFGPSVTGPASYILMVVAPLFAALATLWRGRSHTTSVRSDWYTLSLALTIWAAGAFGNLWQEMVLHRQNEMYRASILAFNLAVVPTTFLLASDWRLHRRQLLRAVDALVALALGCVYFQYTWSMINDHSAPAEAGVAYLVWLLDLQNLYLTAGAMVRWYIAEDSDERDLFRALSVYTAIYFVIVFINDHYFAGNPAFGPQYGTMVTLAFAVLCSFALRAPSQMPARSVNEGVVRMVRSASPILLAVALLVASLFLIRVDYLSGCAGILIAVLGIGVRTTLIQVHQIEHREALRREAMALQTIAWTDALTGVPNRHFFSESLARAWRSDRRPGHQAILMIDIDHFKLLNDRYGHPGGDGCLRDVARALQSTLDRPDDVLARYGGEEFIVLLRDCPVEIAQAVAERLRAAVQSLRIENAGSPERVVTVSIGVATGELTDESSAARLVEDADRALYQAKCAGRNLVKLAKDLTYDEAAHAASITARRRRLLGQTSSASGHTRVPLS